MEVNLKKPIIIAHRGFSSQYPENTLVSVKKAIDAGCDSVEIDVHQTRDERIVVIHDDSIKRTTKGKGEVLDLDYDTLQKYDAGSWFDVKFKNEYVPSLEEIMEVIAGQVNIIIDIKYGSERYPNFERNLVNIINHYEDVADIIVSSYKITVLSKLNNYNSDLQLAKLISPGEMWRTLFDSNLRKFGNKLDFIKEILPHYTFINAGFISWARDREFKIFPYTVNDERTMRNLIERGVDGIITDSPDKLYELLKNYE